MAGPKRASMREGPLAALFRKTEESPEESDPRERREAREQPRARETPARRPFEQESSAPLHDDPEPERERLREAFSSERVAAHASPRELTGQPVIRVVGVGGAGVNAVNRMVEAQLS